jgi:S-methylmethionine-dependent homocysteine/selenocysteine methylase
MVDKFNSRQLSFDFEIVERDFNDFLLDASKIVDFCSFKASKKTESDLLHDDVLRQVMRLGERVQW